MLLKNVKAFLLKRVSITTHLAVSYALSTFVLLAVMALFLYGEMVDMLHKNDWQFLVDEIDIISGLLKNPDNNNSLLKHEVQDVPLILHHSTYHYAVRVSDSKDKVLLETPGMRQALAGAEFLNTPASNTKEFVWWRNANHEKYLLMKMSVRPDPKIQDVWQIQAALDVSFQHNWIQHRRHIALLMLCGGEIFAIIFGYMVAQRGLRRLHDMMLTTRNITAKSLHQRIDAQSWPKELRELGLAFNEMLDRIEIAFENLTEFSADLAHELRTPVNNMLGETEIALSHCQDNEVYSRIFESNIEELQRISKIIENILFLAHAENPQLDLKKQELVLRNEIAVVCEFYRAMADDRSIKINISGNAKVMANQLMLRRALNNVLSNALKYSAPGGQVDFDIIETDSHTVEIRIKDCGAGIPPEHLPKIFNRFYRVTSVNTQKQGGNGLGLAIVKSILKLHQGSIKISSQIGEGTTVTLRFAK